MGNVRLAGYTVTEKQADDPESERTQTLTARELPKFYPLVVALFHSDDIESGQISVDVVCGLYQIIIKPLWV
jgi:hypothetical protein